MNMKTDRTATDSQSNSAQSSGFELMHSMKSHNFGKKFAQPFLALLTVGFGLVAMVAPCRAQEEQPFEGYGEGIITWTSGTTAEIDWTGVATVLGNFTRKEFLTIDGLDLYGSVIFTAANGDELYADFQGSFYTLNDASGDYTITGGTGRLIDASGEASFFASRPDFIHATVFFLGTIRY
jgi:hypothetical protein